MERHLLYLRAQLEAVEKKEGFMGVSYVEEKTLLTELCHLASPQFCHIDRVGPEFWTDCLRAYLLVEDVLAYRLTTSREATAMDLERGRDLVARYEAKHGKNRDQALAKFCLFLFNLNEFILL